MVSSRTLALAVYLLYIAQLFTGFTALIGLIIAYFQQSSEESYLKSHYRFQIRTFWIALLYIVIGAILAIFLVGWLLLLLIIPWILIRVVRGLLLLNKDQPIPDPSSWGFGG
jgi:uncharacterized membrane protein